MKSRALASLAALSLLAMPMSVQAAKPAEIELHIEATAQVPPDRVVVPITVKGSGQNEAAARADLRTNEASLVAALAENGVAAAQIKADGAEAGQDPVTIRPSEEDAGCAAADAAAEASYAAADAAGPATKRAKLADPAMKYDGCGNPINVVVGKTLLVTLDDPAKLEPIQKLGGVDSSYGRQRPVFSQSDSVAAHKKARSEALAKAKAEADGYADAMGYRVVRIVRVSNARPSISMFDMIAFIATMDNKSALMQPSWFGATVAESVAIDYVIAPK